MIKKAIRWFIGIGGGSVGVLIYFLMYNILETVKPAYMSKSIFDVAMLTTLFILFYSTFFDEKKPANSKLYTKRSI